MARVCTVCTHPKRAKIDEALVAGKPQRAIARRTGLSKDALRRHFESHLPKSLVAVHQRKEEKQARTLLERVEELESKARAILDNAESAHIQLSALRELRGIVELLGKVTGELREGPQVAVNLLVAPEWQRIQAAIFEALESHPGAKLAVAEKLRLIGDGS